MNICLFLAAILFFLTVDVAIMAIGIRKKTPRLRFYAYGMVLLQSLGCLLSAWYFSSDLYTRLPNAYRDGFVEMILCLIGAGVFAITLLFFAVVGHWQRVREMTS